MKKILLICLLGWACLPFLEASAYSDLFSYDTVKIRIEMEPLQELEELVSENEDILVSHYPGNLAIVTLSAESGIMLDPVLSGFIPNTPIDIPPFAWGCLLSGFGVAWVYNATHDTEDTRKAFMGCIVNGIVLTSIYIINLLVNY